MMVYFIANKVALKYVQSEQLCLRARPGWGRW